MAMIEIRTLPEFNPTRFQELSSGYTSPVLYQVTKSETDSGAVISLTLKELETPYIKHWESPPEEIEYYRKIIEEGLSIGAYDGDELVGIAIAEKKSWNRTLWIWEFHVDQRYHQRGIGRQMIERLAQIGRAAGCRVMVCETQNTNVPAIRFYRQVGFELGAIDLSYYTNRDITDFEVAIFMKRFIED